MTGEAREPVVTSLEALVVQRAVRGLSGSHRLLCSADGMEAARKEWDLLNVPRLRCDRPPAVGEPAVIGVDQMRRDWNEALDLASRMPLCVPARERVAPISGRLREYVEFLAPEVDVAIAAECHDTADRETARWLLVRVCTTLNQGPGPNDRTAAVHMEDLALDCRALAVICSHLEETGALVAIAYSDSPPPPPGPGVGDSRRRALADGAGFRPYRFVGPRSRKRA
ncbi:DUF6415 family natural product biosynthesis protein [Streptomyces nodosus]|uniref:DUF6415 family natural product biosynthesis protein n=1 Tax=Streptomyces nodosus TaxID=40318 RepID=UPI0034541C74